MDSACAPGVAGPAYADIEDGGEGGGDSRTKVESLTLGTPRNCRACSGVVVSVPLSTKVVDDAMAAAASVSCRPRAPVLCACMNSSLSVIPSFRCARSGDTK